MSFPTSTPRTHRLPHKSDYILIPAPPDLSLSQATGNSPLPAIIVTPPSPVPSHNFFIAFLPKPSLRERIVSWRCSLLLKIRFILIVLFIVFALICHLAADRLAVRRPYLEFNTQSGDDAPVLDSPTGSLDLQSFFAEKHALFRPDFIINDSPSLP